LNTLLLLEDEADAGELLKTALEMEGFGVHWVRDGQAATAALADVQAKPLRLAVLDVRVPGPDGLAVLRHLRQQPRTQQMPVLLLTALDDDDARVQGLMLGADDYLPKPASPRVVLAHIQALLRRTEAGLGEVRIAGPATLRLRTLELQLPGVTVSLTGTEAALLALLFTQPERVFQRQEMLNHLSLTEDRAIFDRTIDAHIKNIRLKLGTQAAFIRTVRGVGYGLNTAIAARK